MKRILGIALGLLVQPTTHAFAQDMTFQMGSAGSTDGFGWIYAEGEIKTYTPDQFRQFLDENSEFSHQMVVLNSPGGNLLAGLELGRIIREHKLDTTVDVSAPRDENFEDLVGGGQCASACSYAFLGGFKRVAENETVGVHQFFFLEDRDNPYQVKYSGQDLSDEQKTVAAVLEYVVEMGVDARVVVSASRTVPTDVHWLTTEEMAEFDVTRDPYAYSPWALELYKGKLISASKTDDTSRTATIYCGSNTGSLMLFLTQDIGRGHSESVVTSIQSQGANLFGQDIPNDDIFVKSDGNNLVMTFKLPNQIVAEESDYPTGLSSAGAFRFYYQQAIQYDNFNEHARVIMKHCD